jgi:pilus assembly protein Flp/PilA
MKNLYNGIRKFAKDEEGASAVEYGMMVGLIAVAIIITVAAIGTQLNTLFTTIKECLTDSSAAACTGA